MRSSLNGGCRFSKKTVAGMHRYERDAPEAAAPASRFKGSDRSICRSPELA